MTREKLLSRVAIDAETGCWRWTGCHTTGGYGQLRHDGKARRAHRVAYQLFVGPIPEGLTIDHVRARGCRHRDCCNPEHLEPVPLRTNILRGSSPAAVHAVKTHCLRGHEFTLENTRMEGGRRRCRACIRELRGQTERTAA